MYPATIIATTISVLYELYLLRVEEKLHQTAIEILILFFYFFGIHRLVRYYFTVAKRFKNLKKDYWSIDDWISRGTQSTESRDC